MYIHISDVYAERQYYYITHIRVLLRNITLEKPLPCLDHVI